MTKLSDTPDNGVHEYQLTLTGGWLETFYSRLYPINLRIELSKGMWPKDVKSNDFYNPSNIVRVKHVRYHPEGI